MPWLVPCLVVVIFGQWFLLQWTDTTSLSRFVFLLLTIFVLSNPQKNLQGLAGKPMTTGTALLRIAFVWIFATAWTLAPLFGWNRLI
jgi:hypothetical protein